MPAPRPNRVVLALAAAFCLPQSVLGQTAATSTSSVASTDPVPVKSLGVVTVNGGPADLAAHADSRPPWRA